MKNNNKVPLFIQQNQQPHLRQTPLEKVQSNNFHKIQSHIESENAFGHFAGQAPQNNRAFGSQRAPNQLFNNLSNLNMQQRQSFNQDLKQQFAHGSANIPQPQYMYNDDEQFYQNQPYDNDELADIQINNDPMLNGDQLDSPVLQELNNQFSQNLNINNNTYGAQNSSRLLNDTTQNLELDEIKRKLKELFNYYASFGDRLNVSNLKSSKFHKMMIDSKILYQGNMTMNDDNFLMEKKKIDLIFCQVNKHKPNMQFENFLQALTKIAEQKYPHLNKIDALQDLLNNHLLQLYDKVQAQKQYVTKDLNFDLQFDELVSILIKNVGAVLQEIYYVYFQHEIRGSLNEDQTRKTNEKVIFEFLRDFDICPTLITKSIAYKIYLSAYENPLPTYQSTGIDIIESSGQSLSQKTQGRYFTFLKFLDLLMKCAKATYSDCENSNNLIEAEMFCLLLERMELSKGFNNFEKRTFKPHTSKITLLPSKAIINQINIAKSTVYEINSENQEAIVSHRQRKLPRNSRQKENMQEGGGFMTFQENNDKKGYQSVQDIKDDLRLQQQEPSILDQLYEQHQERLMKIFQYYCSYGEPLNNNKLKSSKFIKLLKESNILLKGVLKTQESEQLKNNENVNTTNYKAGVSGITQIDADLIFKKLTKASTNSKTQSTQQPQQIGRMDFEQFIKAIAIVSNKMYTHQDIKVSFEMLVENNLSVAEQVINTSDRGVQNSQQHISQLMEILKDEFMVEILSCVHRTLLPYFQYYSNNKGLMNFDGFSKFCHDFGIFPDILSKAKIMKFFSTLASFYLSTNNDSKSYNTSYMTNTSVSEMMNGNREVIDEHLFIEALALTAFEVNYKEPQPSDSEKVLPFNFILTPIQVILLMERMNHSQGPAKVQLSYGRTRFGCGETNDLLHVFRQQYPQFFQQMINGTNQSQMPQQNDAFDQLISARTNQYNY